MLSWVGLHRFTDASRPMERNTTFHEMVWHPHKNGHLADGQWQATKVGKPMLHPSSGIWHLGLAIADPIPLANLLKQ